MKMNQGASEHTVHGRGVLPAAYAHAGRVERGGDACDQRGWGEDHIKRRHARGGRFSSVLRVKWCFLHHPYHVSFESGVDTNPRYQADL